MALSPNVVVVAPGELITSDHLNRVRSNLERIDTGDAALSAVMPRTTVITVSVSNAPQGITGLTGTGTILANPTASTYLWTTTWNYALAGHTLGSEYRVRIINASDGTALAISGYDHYDANESHTGVYVATFARAAAAAILYLGFQIEIVTAFANTNVAGVASSIGIAT